MASWRARVAGRTSGSSPRPLWGAWWEGGQTDALPGPDSAPAPARPRLDPHPSLDPWPRIPHPPYPAPPRSPAQPEAPARPSLASTPGLYSTLGPPGLGSPPRLRLASAPGPASPRLSPRPSPGLASPQPLSPALTAPAQPRAGPQLGPRPRLGPSPASPSAAAAQMLLGGRRWFRSHKMAALTAATSVPAAAGDAGERGSPPRSPTHSPFAVRTRRLCAGGRDRTLGRRRLAHRCACARPPRPQRA